MSYDLETLNQAWHIACEECMRNMPDETGDEAMFEYILDYCRRETRSLIHDAIIELNERSRGN